MVFAVRDLMRDAYPELDETAERVSKAVQAEETRFAHTMDGLRVRKRFGDDITPRSELRYREAGGRRCFQSVYGRSFADARFDLHSRMRRVISWESHVTRSLV